MKEPPKEKSFYILNGEHIKQKEQGRRYKNVMVRPTRIVFDPRKICIQISSPYLNGSFSIKMRITFYVYSVVHMTAVLYISINIGITSIWHANTVCRI